MGAVINAASDIGTGVARSTVGGVGQGA